MGAHEGSSSAPAGPPGARSVGGSSTYSSVIEPMLEAWTEERDDLKAEALSVESALEGANRLVDNLVSQYGLRVLQGRGVDSQDIGQYVAEVMHSLEGSVGDDRILLISSPNARVLDQFERRSRRSSLDSALRREREGGGSSEAGSLSPRSRRSSYEEGPSRATSAASPRTPRG